MFYFKITLGNVSKTSVLGTLLEGK